MKSSSSPATTLTRKASKSPLPKASRPLPSRTQHLDRAVHDAMMHDRIVHAGATHVALAGYMRILSEAFVQKWEGRMLNVHPSLLPKYKGLHTHQRAIEAGDSHGGCSVHLVTAELDDGPVLGQMQVAILPDDTADTLAERVKLAEHQLYPRILAEYVSRDTDPEWLVQQVRERALAQPEADEVTSHGMPCFGIIGGKKFAYVSVDHHGDGKTALLVKISGAEEQAMLIDSDARPLLPPRLFRRRLDRHQARSGRYRLGPYRRVAGEKLAGGCAEEVDQADGCGGGVLGC